MLKAKQKLIKSVTMSNAYFLKSNEKGHCDLDILIKFEINKSS